jgi:hypothetical protein
MLSLNVDVNVPTVRNKQKNVKNKTFTVFSWHLESHCQKEQDPE